MHMRTSSYGENMPEGAPYQAVPPPQIKAFPELLRDGGYFTINDVKTDYQFGNPFTVWDISRAGADWNMRQAGQPFFAMINHEVTHESRTWAPDTDPALHPLAAMRARLNQELDARKTFERTDPSEVPIPPYWPDTAAVRENLARFYDNITLLDEEIGTLLQRLESEGRFADSIIIFTTDHGDGLPRHKRTIFDTGTRVPLLVRFPDGSGAGTTREDLVSLIDLAPTILGLARRPIPGWIQGRNLFSDPAPSAIFMGGDRFDEVPQRFRGVRESRWHYIRYYGETPVIPSLAFQNVNPIMREMRRLHATGALNTLQAHYLVGPAPRDLLFDTLADPHEVHNLANDPAHRAVLERMAGRLDRWIAQSGDQGTIPEAKLVARMWPGGPQPETAAVAACMTGSGSVVLHSATPGASVGYGGPDGESRLYSRPLNARAPFMARAVRYGYRPSLPVHISPETIERC
jgi:arylsulfatase A-like enzyme